MLPRLLTNLMLLVIVITLGFFIYLKKNEPLDNHRLTLLEKNSITQIEIRHRARVTTLEKSGKHWRMTQPIKIDANDFRINTLLDMLASTSLATYPAATLALEKYELDSVQTSITFNDTTIAFGSVNPVNHNRYVMIGDRVHLVADMYYPLISSQLGALISQTLLPRDAVVNRLALPEQTLSRTDTGWQSSDPDIHTDAIVETINHWRNSQAFGAHTYNPRSSLGKIEVDIDGKDEPLVFEITDIEPWLIIARPALDIEYHFNLEFYDRLLRPGASAELPAEFQDNSQPLTDGVLRPL